MKAIVITKYGSADGLQLQEVEKPSPADDEVLVKVHAATVTAGDVMLRKLPFPVWIFLRLFMGLKRKKIPGHELAGVVEAVGKDVQRFQVGDRVFGTTTGLSVGANAEYVCLPETRDKGVLERVPANTSFEVAAAVPVGAMTALQLLKKGRVEGAQSVLIYGASGSVGSFAVQIAKHFGATVTAVCSTRNVDWVSELGADRVIDYTKEDFTERGETYDLIFDAVGKAPPSRSRELLKENGVFESVRSSTNETLENLIYIRELVEAGQLSPVIDRRYPLEQTAGAHRYVEEGHKQGNVVITIQNDHDA
jgi:NADPH:quinone reductase-like Zn-dependent oxidoreductase